MIHLNSSAKAFRLPLLVALLLAFGLPVLALSENVDLTTDGQPNLGCLEYVAVCRIEGVQNDLRASLGNVPINVKSTKSLRTILPENEISFEISASAAHSTVDLHVEAVAKPNAPLQVLCIVVKGANKFEQYQAVSSQAGGNLDVHLELPRPNCSCGQGGSLPCDRRQLGDKDEPMASEEVEPLALECGVNMPVATTATATQPLFEVVLSQRFCGSSVQMSRFHYKAPAAGTYFFDTTGSQCRDTVIIVAGPSGCYDTPRLQSRKNCNDDYFDIADADNHYAALVEDLAEGETVTVFVGSYKDQCDRKKVSLTVTRRSESPTSSPSTSPTVFGVGPGEDNSTLSPTFPTNNTEYEYENESNATFSPTMPDNSTGGEHEYENATFSPTFPIDENNTGEYEYENMTLSPTFPIDDNNTEEYEYENMTMSPTFPIDDNGTEEYEYELATLTPTLPGNITEYEYEDNSTEYEDNANATLSPTFPIGNPNNITSSPSIPDDNSTEYEEQPSGNATLSPTGEYEYENNTATASPSVGATFTSPPINATASPSTVSPNATESPAAEYEYEYEYEYEAATSSPSKKPKTKRPTKRPTTKTPTKKNGKAPTKRNG